MPLHRLVSFCVSVKPERLRNPEPQTQSPKTQFLVTARPASLQDQDFYTSRGPIVILQKAVLNFRSRGGEKLEELSRQLASRVIQLF